jgi:hypothetical protein
MPKLQWEEIYIGPGHMKRAKVPGGWLVLVEMGQGIGLTFYPDPNHTWNGNSLP